MRETKTKISLNIFLRRLVIICEQLYGKTVTLQSHHFSSLRCSAPTTAFANLSSMTCSTRMSRLSQFLRRRNKNSRTSQSRSSPNSHPSSRLTPRELLNQLNQLTLFKSIEQEFNYVFYLLYYVKFGKQLYL